MDLPDDLGDGDAGEGLRDARGEGNEPEDSGLAQYLCDEVMQIRDLKVEIKKKILFIMKNHKVFQTTSSI